MAKRKQRSSETKSDLVRQYIAKHPGESIAEIQRGLQGQGIEVSRALASKIKYSRGAKPGAKRRGGGRRKAATGSPTKAELIRTEIRQLGPRFRPRDVVAALEGKGVTVLGSQVIAVAKALGMQRRRRGRPAVAAAKLGAAPREVVSLEDLIAAKRLVEKLGGIEAAANAVAALKRLS